MNVFIELDPSFLNNVDPLSQKTFQELICSRKNAGRTYHLCEVQQEGNRSFFFDGACLIEYCFKYINDLKNPLTREPLGEISILKATEIDGRFERIAKGVFGSLQPLEYLPLILEDHEKEADEKAKAHYNMGFAYYSGDGCEVNMKLAYTHFEMAHRLGHKDAAYAICAIYRKQKKPVGALHWLDQHIKDRVLTVSDYIDCGSTLEEYAKSFPSGLDSLSKSTAQTKKAFAYFHKGALAGNLYCIAKMVAFFENGFSESNHAIAKQWRELIPQEDRDLPIYDYMKRLLADPRCKEQTQVIDVTPTLRQEKPAYLS